MQKRKYNVPKPIKVAIKKEKIIMSNKIKEAFESLVVSLLKGLKVAVYIGISIGIAYLLNRLQFLDVVTINVILVIVKTFIKEEFPDVNLIQKVL